jgi:hypothetical protein
MTTPQGKPEEMATSLCVTTLIVMSYPRFS